MANKKRRKTTAVKPPAGTLALAVVKAAGPDSAVTMFERLAKDASVPVEKLERLIELQERIMAFHAKTAFNAAFSEMQGKIPVVAKNGKVAYKDVKYAFATHADIQRVVRPILEQYGFTLRHRNEYIDGGVKIIGILSHRAGHSEQDEFVAPCDNSGSKNAIQAIGSTREYGRRYTTCALLNITTEEQDDDGQASSGRQTTVDGNEAPRRSAPPPASHHAASNEPITDPQRKRLWVLIKKAGRAETEVKMWLKARYGIDSSKAITRMLYDEVCQSVEAPGPLPLPREPGDE